MKQPSNSRLGFTLLELFLSIAVLAIMVSLLLPAVGKTRDASRNATNVNNLKQIGIAMLSYGGDHSGVMPQTLQVIRVGGKSTKGSFLTSGIDCYEDGTVRKLFSRDTWPGFGTSTTNYLANPEVLYGPFTPLLNTNREKGKPWEMAPNRFRIGYVFYYTPVQDESAFNPKEGVARKAPLDPEGRPISNSLLQTAHPRSPLFSDIINSTLAADTGYPLLERPITNVVRMDGSVQTFPSSTIRNSTDNKVRTLAGYPKN